MPAPFVVAHMQVSLLLRELGADLIATSRAAVYLTNALTGWDAPDDVKNGQHQMQMAAFAELLAERDQARGLCQISDHGGARYQGPSPETR